MPARAVGTLVVVTLCIAGSVRPLAQAPAQPPAGQPPQAQPPGGQPPPGQTPVPSNQLYVIGRDPIAAPRVIKTVKPDYTPEAMRNRIQGVVRMRAVVERDGTVSGVEVIQSLDARLGLDQSAVNALRQWQFQPGTLNGTPVRVAVNVDMAFTLRDSAPLQTWPEGFSAGTPAADGVEEADEAQMLRVRLTRPSGWVRTPPAPPPLWLRINSGDGRDLAVLGPTAEPSDLHWPVADTVVAAAAESVRRTQPADAELVGRGQVQTPGGMVWVWASFKLPSLPEVMEKAPGNQFRAAHLWSFTTTVDRKQVTVMCSVLIPRDLEGAAADARVDQAAAEFSGILNSLKFEAPTK